MTSIDSGVDTGNDSNDSGQAEGHLRFVTNVVKRGRPLGMPRQRRDPSKQLGIVDKRSETTTPTTIVCLTQSPSPLSLHFVSNGVASGGGRTLEQALEFCLPEPLMRNENKWRCKSNGKDGLGINFDKGGKICSKRDKRRVKLYQSLWEKRMRIGSSTNNIELVKRLLEKGITPNNADTQGRTPLHLACSSGFTDIVKLLLDYGADPNRTDILGNTPLHLAAVTTKTSVVVLLLKAGTNILTFDRHGYNPLQLAQTKLRMLQNCKSAEILKMKEEVHRVVEMLMAYFQQQKDVGVQMEALSSFCSRLSLSHTTDQVQDDVKDLLASIDSLSLSNN